MCFSIVYRKTKSFLDTWHTHLVLVVMIQLQCIDASSLHIASCVVMGTDQKGFRGDGIIRRCRTAASSHLASNYGGYRNTALISNKHRQSNETRKCKSHFFCLSATRRHPCTGYVKSPKPLLSGVKHKNSASGEFY